MAVLFRQSMLLNGILCNSEVLYGVSKHHVETLESVDNFFWRKLFKCPITTPIETYFMETHTIPIRFVLVSRRLMYYWNILQMNEDELVKRVFTAQQISSCRNDWVLQICDDLKLCKISKSEEEIKKMKRHSFKMLVRRKVREVTDEYLVSLKKSKSMNIWPSDNMKSYLKTNLISTEEKQLLYLMRCRMNDLKSNFQNKYKNNLNCSLCKQECKESESHLLQCVEIISEPDINLQNLKYSDIYGNLGDQIKAVQIWKKIFKIRTWKIENRSLSHGPQVHRPSASYSCDSQAVDPPSLDNSSTNVLLSHVYDSGS